MNQPGTESPYNQANFQLPYKGGQVPSIHAYIPWQFGMRQKIQGENMIMHQPFMQGGSFTNGTIAAPSMSGGTYNNGILGTPTVTGGTWSSAILEQMTLLNNQLGTIIDTTGLVSSTNFPNGGASGNTTISTAATSYQDIPGSSADIVLKRGANVLTIMTAIGLNTFAYNHFQNQMNVKLTDSIAGDLTTVTMSAQAITFGSNLFLYDQFVTAENLSFYAAGTHTLKMQYSVVNAGTASLDNWEWLYVVLGS